MKNKKNIYSYMKNKNPSKIESNTVILLGFFLMQGGKEI